MYISIIECRWSNPLSDVIPLFFLESQKIQDVPKKISREPETATAYW